MRSALAASSRRTSATGAEQSLERAPHDGQCVGRGLDGAMPNRRSERRRARDHEIESLSPASDVEAQRGRDRTMKAHAQAPVVGQSREVEIVAVVSRPCPRRRRSRDRGTTRSESSATRRRPGCCDDRGSASWDRRAACCRCPGTGNRKNGTVDVVVDRRLRHAVNREDPVLSQDRQVLDDLGLQHVRTNTRRPDRQTHRR